MNETTRSAYVKKLVEGIAALGPRFERFANIFLQHYLGVVLDGRGLNIVGHPVGYTLDSISDSGDVVLEASAEEDYFRRGLHKFWSDLRHVRELQPKARNIFLLAAAVAPNTARNTAARASNRYERCFGGKVFLFDARRIAESIVDRLLDSDLAVRQAGELLPSIIQIRDETVGRNDVPKPVPGYIRRPALERSFVEQLEAKRFAVIAGVGGAGKSQLCAAVAHACMAERDLVLWFNAANLETLIDLRSVPGRSGAHRDFVSLLEQRRCLLVLDDLRVAASDEELAELAGKRSRVLVSRRNRAASAVEIPLLSRDECSALVNRDLDVKCPPNVLSQIEETVGGHPLSLALINAAARGGTTWDDLVEDLSAVGRFLDERQQRLADRVLARLIPSIGRELAFFRWCEAALCDREFARAALKPVGIRNLESSCTLALADARLLRVHDVVFAALENVPAIDFTSEFDTFLRGTAEDDGDVFLSAARVHARKLDKLVRSGEASAAIRLAWMKAVTPGHIDPARVREPMDAAAACPDAAAGELPLAIREVLESVEALYRHAKEHHGDVRAKEELNARMAVFDRLAALAGSLAPLTASVKHHQGKALVLLGRRDEAIQLFEAVVAGPYPLDASRLQLIRLYAKDNAERAEQLVDEVLGNVGNSSMSVGLASVAAVGRFKEKLVRNRIFERHAARVSELIASAISSHPDEAMAAFAVVASSWAWGAPERFFELWQQLPPCDNQLLQREESRFAYADAMREVAERLKLDEPEAQTLRCDALKLIDGMAKPNGYHLQVRGKLLVEMSRFDEAIAQLEALDDPKSKAWRLYHLSRAKLALGRADEAHVDIEAALQALGDQRDYEATFVAQRARCLHRLGDARAVGTMRTAIDVCSDARHRSGLEAELAKFEAALPPMSAGDVRPS